MSRRVISTITAVAWGLISIAAVAQHIAPSALLTIDQNRTTVVERIVGEWGDRLAVSNAGISAPQLRQILSGLRSDHLLAASLAGSVEGLRDVVSGALVRSDAAVSPTLMHTKSLGDTTDDLVYTPVVPCRIVDTRSGGGGVFLPGNQRNWLAFSLTGFASQGGSATNCGIPVRPVAIMANTTLANTVGGPEFFTVCPFGQARPTASTVNWFGPGQQPANAEIVPLCTGAGCTADFSAFASGQTHAIIDVLGYFNRPTNYGGTHTITGEFATDSGGQNNTASGFASTVAGGANNIASGDYSTVAGGVTNTASGIGSTVAGGDLNLASGELSFAAGHRAKASTEGSFIWADSQAFDFGPSVPDFFGVRATGGVGLTVAINPSTGAVTQFCNLLPGTPSWQCTSDRDAKENFVPADGKDILQRLVAMPLSSWNLKGADPTIRSLGPTAQDFYAAFGLGRNDKSIANVNLEGVALAAIQGLHQMMRQKDAKLQQQSREISALKREMLAIKAKLGM